MHSRHYSTTLPYVARTHGTARSYPPRPVRRNLVEGVCTTDQVSRNFRTSLKERDGEANRQSITHQRKKQAVLSSSPNRTRGGEDAKRQNTLPSRLVTSHLGHISHPRYHAHDLPHGTQLHGGAELLVQVSEGELPLRHAFPATSEEHTETTNAHAQRASASLTIFLLVWNLIFTNTNRMSIHK